MRQATRWLATDVDTDQPNSLVRCFSEEMQAQFPSNAIPAVVLGCATIHEAVQEGLDLASIEHRPVVFNFNQHLVVCPPGGLLQPIVDAWFVRATGRTAQETLDAHDMARGAKKRKS